MHPEPIEAQLTDEADHATSASKRRPRTDELEICMKAYRDETPQ
jgi:hypothetical protein